MISLVPVYSAGTRAIRKIGCDDCISSLDTVDSLDTEESFVALLVAPGGLMIDSFPLVLSGINRLPKKFPKP